MIITSIPGRGTIERQIKARCWHKAFRRGQVLRQRGIPIPPALADASPKSSALLRGWTWQPCHLDDINASIRRRA
jgi:hypothetical protein